MPTFKLMLAWPIGPGGALRSSQGQRVNVYDPGTTTVPLGLTQGGQAVSWVTSDEDGAAEFTTTSASVVDLATPDGRFTRRVESEENIGSGGGGGVTDHGLLTGLADDDHTQYHTNARGDARYSQLGHTHTASQVTDLDGAIGDKAAVAVLNSTLGQTGGVPTKPWQPPALVGGELATVGNLYINAGFPNLITARTNLTVTGSSASKTERIIMKSGAYYLRLAFDYDVSALTGGGWYNITVGWKNTGDGIATPSGAAQVMVSHNGGNPLTGRLVFDLERPLAPSGSVAGLEVAINLWNNVTGGTATVTNVSLQALSGPSRMCYWTGLGPVLNNDQAFLRYHYDANERRWYASFESFGKSSGAYQYNGIVGVSDLLPFQDPGVVPDPTFMQPQSGSSGGRPGLTGPTTKVGLVQTAMRATNNDQILVVQPQAGGAFEYRGNVHGGEALNGSVVAKVHDGSTWRTVTSELEQTGLFPAQRFQWTLPTKMTCTGDASHFCTVDHLFTAFPDGVTRCDRTTTFLRDTNISEVFEWMSSYDPLLPRLGRMGRGSDVTASIDAFTRASVPAAPTVTTSGTGGTLAAATYSYRVTALTPLGETLASTAATVVSTGSTSKNTVTWAAVTNATGYRVYGRTAGVEYLLATINPGVLSWEDTGAVGGLALPPKEDTGRVPGSRANVMPLGDDRATWACWFDPISGWAHGNIYDREALLTRTASGVTGGKAQLVALPGIVKNYNTLNLTGSSVTVPNGTAWTATHWSMIWRPEDPERFHHEIATRAASLAGLKDVYPTT